MPATIRYRNEATRHLMDMARRYGWRGKTYESAKRFVRTSKSRVLRQTLGLVLAARNIRRRK